MSKLEQLPLGDLMCTQNGTYTKWYLKNGSKPIYLKKSDREYAQNLALRKLVLLELEECQETLHLLEHYLLKCEKTKDKISQLFSDSNGFMKLLSPNFSPSAKEISIWQSASYNHCQYHTENLVHKTLAGHMVRSKSEVIIANSLFLNHIPYRYECALLKNSLTIYPDFTILHPTSLKIFYWEHFGMMDVPSYRESCWNKLNIYTSNGILPGNHLITTYETSDCPIDSNKIQILVETNFL